MKRIKLIKLVSKQWWSNFMANLLGVIIGIVITFGVSSLIQRSNEQKDVREIMILLKKELKENREWLDKQRGNFLDDLSAYKEILDANGDWGKISDDVVAATRAIRIKFKSTNVWDIFKNSEVIAKYHDKNLVLALAECYYYIDTAQELMDEYYEEKRKATHTIFELYTVHPHQYLDALTGNKASKYFLERIVILDDYPITYHFSLFIDLLDYIVYLIDKDGDYNEETIKKDSDILDFESFRKRSK